MSLGDMYTLGVRIQGDISSLRAELAAGKALADDFAKSASGALGQAASSMEQATTAMEASARRSGRATQVAGSETRRTADAFSEYQRKAREANEDVARSSEDSSQRTTQSLGGIGRVLGRLTGVAGMAMLAKQVWDTGKGFHEFAQNSEVALSNMLGGLPEAKEFLADILAFAKETPFSFPELTETAQQLLAMNMAAEDVIPTLRSLGDAAASQGQGMARLEQLAGIIGQINTLGALGGQEMRRLQQAGVPALTGLANLAGVTTDEFRQMVSDGLVPADEAIRNLRIVIDEGTEGINGQTVAMGGLMEQIKGAGGLTATMDSTGSSFRNASAALTESLTPAFLNLLRATQGFLGFIQQAAESFNALPTPVQNAAIAFGLAATAMRLLNIQARATGAWAGIQAAIARYRTSVAAARVQTEIMTATMSRSQAVMYQARTAAVAATGAMRGLSAAFGGPVGLAIAGAVAGMAAFSSASSQARQDTADLADTLDQMTGKFTAQSTELVKNALLVETHFFEGFTNATIAETAERMGVSIETLTRAWLGQADAVQEVRRATEQYEADASFGERITLSRSSEAQALNRYLDDQLNRLDAARRLVAEKKKVDEGASEAVREQGSAYEDANRFLREFSEEQTKAIEQAQENARKAMTVDMSSLGLDIAQEDDVTQAREKVEQATRRVRDAEESRAALTKREKATDHDRIRAEESVLDARKALDEATRQLAETEERTDPVEQYKKHVNGIIEANETFLADIQELADRGLNLTDLQDIMNRGAEATVDVRAALLGDDDMVEFQNEARKTMEKHAETLASQAHVVEAHMQDTGNKLMGEVGLGMRLAAAQESSDTLMELAARLGEKASDIRTVGNALGLEFVNGFRDSLRFDIEPRFLPGRGRPGAQNTFQPFHQGGIYPGYTPGRDIGFIGVSGGEAIMRPEWTRAVGPDLVHRWNRVARTAGVDGVRAEMRKFLGGFANGGIAGGAPQVVTVPVESTNQHYSPINVGTVVAADVDDFRRQAMQQRRRNNIGGFRG